MDVSKLPDHYGRNFTKNLYTKASATIEPQNTTLPAGYTVVIIGAGKGIGEHIARAYAAAKASSIIITSRTASDLERVKGELERINSKVNVATVPGDATKAEHYAGLRNLIETSFNSRIDTIICNAGPGPLKGGWGRSFDDIDPEDFLEVTKINYVGPFYAAKYLMGLLQSGKTIINITSGASQMTKAGLTPISYCISKNAQNRLSQWIGENWADEGINCIALHPGSVRTPGAVDLSPAGKDALNHILVDDIDLCGAVCVWLSKEGRPWASGRYLRVNWDMDELEQRQEEIVKNDLLKSRMAV